MIVVSALFATAIVAPLHLEAGCPLLQRTDITCRTFNPACTETISVYICSSPNVSSIRCVSGAYTIPCCGADYRSAGTGGNCSGNPGDIEGALPNTDKILGIESARIYLPTCEGGYAPLLMRSSSTGRAN